VETSSAIVPLPSRTTESSPVELQRAPAQQATPARSTTPVAEATRLSHVQRDAQPLVSGGRGVAQAADLGNARSERGSYDVFESPTHVVEAPACVLDAGAGVRYFGSDPFGQAVAANCR
jgi:hypothetical protein